MEQLVKIARGLLESGKVKVVIGYAGGSGGRARAAFIRKPEDCSKLILNEKCLQNLAVYLTNPEIKALGRPAIVANFGALRTLLQFAQECQINDGDIEIIGFSKDLKITEFKSLKEVEDCMKTASFALDEKDRALIEKIEKMSVKERWAFWTEEFSRCIKCYACRSSCPLCYCSRCLCDCNQPQILSAPSHLAGNLEWHIVRAMHLAGRCVSCGDCGRACPVGIPLHLLTMKIGEDVFRHFEKRAGTTINQEYALSNFKSDDREDFIK